MDNKKIINLIEDMLEVDEGSLSIETKLNEIEEWDSMAAVAFLALADDEFDKKVNPMALKNCKTVGDLVELLKN